MAGPVQAIQAIRPSKIPKPVAEPCDWEGDAAGQPSDDIAERCAEDEKPKADACDFMGEPPSPPPLDFDDCVPPKVKTSQSAPVPVPIATEPSVAAATAPASWAVAESCTQPEIFSDAPENTPEPPSPIQASKS